MTDIIINNTSIQLFNAFNRNYSSRIVEICPLLNEFAIHVVEHTKSNYWNVASCNDYDSFAYFLNKESADVASTYAEIIVNIEMCNKLEFNEEEMFAALAHEIGHVITYFRADKKSFNIQQEEIISDRYACKIGLGTPLETVIKKMIESGYYPNDLIAQMNTRLMFLKYYSND